jgi:hypothetical protein
MDFSTFRVDCSDISMLMGTAKGNKPPTEKQLRDLFHYLGRNIGELTESMKYKAREILTKALEYNPKRASGSILSELVELYCYEVYGKGKVSKGGQVNPAVEKGNMAEPESIRFLSKIDKTHYVKNEQFFENKWFKGIPDIVLWNWKGKVERIIEVKTSYDLPSFIMSMIKPELPKNLFEVMGYMDMTGCRKAEIVHVLVDMPDRIASFQEKRLRDRYTWLELDEVTIEQRIGRRLYDMEYSDIPDELKLFRRPVTYNPISMKEAKRRAVQARKWLADIHDTFTLNLESNLSYDADNYQEDGDF